jgi:hypothetical protein
MIDNSSNSDEDSDPKIILSPAHRGGYGLTDTYEYSPSETSDAQFFNEYPNRIPTPGSTGEVFKTQIKHLESEIHRMHKKHCKLIQDMDSNYAAIEEETH